MCNEMLKVPAMYGISVNYLDKYPVVKDAIDYMNEYEMVEELMAMPKSATCWVELTKAAAPLSRAPRPRKRPFLKFRKPGTEFWASNLQSLLSDSHPGESDKKKSFAKEPMEL